MFTPTGTFTLFINQTQEDAAQQPLNTYMVPYCCGLIHNVTSREGLRHAKRLSVTLWYTTRIFCV